MSVAVYPGTFDPVTLGHVDVMSRAASLFDRVIVAVADRPHAKRTLLSTVDRVDLVRASVKGLPNVDVSAMEGLLVDFARARGSTVIIRGMRTAGDYVRETRLNALNGVLANEVNSIVLLPIPALQHVSSTRVRRLARSGEPIDRLVPAAVAAWFSDVRA